MTDKTRGTILVVEDEPDVQLYLKIILEEEGFHVMTADNGKQALDRIKERRPDLISLDLQMPKMRGVKLLQYLRKNPEWAKIPFVIVTSHMRDEIGKKDMEELKGMKINVGPHSFLEKPIIPSEYVRAIRQFLGNIEEDRKEWWDREGLQSRIISKLEKASEEQLREIAKLLDEKMP